MGSMNKVILVGNLGADVELRYTPGGTAVGNVRLATTETWNDKNSGERREQTEWHRVVLWGKQAETLQEYLKKGRQICVEGRLQTRSWEDRDGNKRYTTEVRSDRVVLLGGRREDGDGGRREDGGGGRQGSYTREQESPRGGPAPDAGGGGGGDDLTEDDIPF